MSTIEIPSLELEIEVTDQGSQTVEIDGSDLCLRGESGTLEVVLMGYTADEEERAMLDHLISLEIVNVEDLSSALQPDTISPVNYVLSLEPEQKLAIVKAIMQEM